MSSSVIGNFVDQYLPYAQSVSQQTGIPVSYILGQAGEESAWGTSNQALTNNNFFGINNPGSTSGTDYAGYSSPQDGFNAYGNLISTPNYASALSIANNGGSAYDYASALQTAGYATDTDQYGNPVYGTKVAGATASVQQYLNNQGGSGAVSDAYNPEYDPVVTGDVAEPGYESGFQPFDATSSQPGAGYASGVPGYGPAEEGYGNPLSTVPVTTSSGGLGYAFAPSPTQADTGGTNYSIGLQFSLVSDVAGWIKDLISPIEGIANATLGQVGNWFVRGALIALAIVLVAIAAWKLLDLPSPATVATEVA